MWLIIEMTVDSNNLRDFLQFTCLIRVAWEKLKVCLRSNMKGKRAFPSSFDLIDRLY